MRNNPDTSGNPGRGDWRGYSFGELRYRRALNSVRIEVEKQRLLSSVQRLNPLGSLAGGGRGLLRGAWGNIDKLALLLLAFKAVRKSAALLRKVRGK